MYEQKQQIRNDYGKLLCEIYFDGEAWVVEIKKGDALSSLFLFPGGSYHVANLSGAKMVSRITEIE